MFVVGSLLQHSSVLSFISCRLMLYSFGGHHFPIKDCFAKWQVPPNWRVLWVEPSDTPMPTCSWPLSLSSFFLPCAAVHLTATHRR